MIDPDLESGEENPYDFIFSKDKTAGPQPDEKLTIQSLFTRQYLLFGLFAVAVLIVAGVVASVLLSKDPPTAPELIRVSAFQSEITRVAEIGNKNSRSFDLGKDVDNLTLVLLTDRQRIASLLSARGVVPTRAGLAQATDQDRDTALADSLQVDRHADVYQEIMDMLVAEYLSAIKRAESAALSATERDQLAAIRRNVEIIYYDEESTSEEGPTEQETEQQQTPVITN